MKSLGKAITNKIATIIVLVMLFAGAVWFFRSRIPSMTGSVSAEYSFVIKRFSQKSQLLVADADVATTAKKTFTSDLTKDWPKWTQFVAKLLVSRELVMEIPIKTEFKLELEGLNQNDIAIENNILTFKKPLTVYVDSQKVGDAAIQGSSTGLVDKTVDVVTGSKKAMEFLEQKSQDAIYATTEEVINDSERKEKVAKFSEEALENLLNLNSDKKIDVQISVDDLVFKNIDAKN